MARIKRHWTNESVLGLAGTDDPVETVVSKARQLVYQALEGGWSGPPFEPVDLAGFLGIEVLPKEDVRDARTVPIGRDRVRIEYNPNRPLHRIRYSVAHEIAHTLFPDCADFVRNRSLYHEASGDSWQIEALCNIGAAELLMPAAMLEDIDVAATSIESLMRLRVKFGVSAEALLIRLTELSDHRCVMFCASTKQLGARYRLDYSIASALWNEGSGAGVVVPVDSAVSECTAIGYTARSTEEWPLLKRVHVECVGIPPYPGTTVPRVVGFALPAGEHAISRKMLNYVTGDATRPRGNAPAIIAHVVNDATANWGGAGFAMALKRRWPKVQEEFARWAAGSDSLQLGNVHFTRADANVTVATIIAQRGYGPSKRPRLRYMALREGLAAIAQHAVADGMTVHMPRIGTGQAGGVWNVVADMIKEVVCAKGAGVNVYTLPGGDVNVGPQAYLPLFPD